MDTQRSILFAVFLFSLFMLWEAWQKEHAPKPVPLPAVAEKPAAAGTVPSAPAAPVVETLAAARAGLPVTPTASLPASALKAERVTVTTDALVAEIDGVGGTLTRVEFIKHRDTHDQSRRFVLLEQSPERTYVAQSGLIGESLPSHKTAFAFKPGPRELKQGDASMDVRLEAVPVAGVKVEKVFTFHRDSYLIGVRYEIANLAAIPLQTFAYFQITRDGKPADGDQRFVSTFTGPAFYTDAEKFHKVEFADLEKEKAKLPGKADNGWVAMLQHYFVSAWLPEKPQDPKVQYEFYAKKVADNLYSAGVVVPVSAIAPGATGTVKVAFYAGPEEQDKLAAIAPGLNLVVDYGWLTIIAAPLFWVLQWLHKLVNNWGVAIILLTCLIKALFFPLSAASYKSMARMRLVTPRLTKIREQYGDDRVKMNQAMMDLYKTEKINPLGGCLPIVVQIPVFIALYWVLLASVEMRHAPFWLWIHDLSAPDPFYVLPVIMTATSYIQIKLNPTPPDPVQAKVMMIMPLAFGVMFFFFPAGLVLYWVVNNVLSIAQQWQITRMIESGKELAKR
jgi:YidC/Oxa1 family membrane protein insertase